MNGSRWTLDRWRPRSTTRRPTVRGPPSRKSSRRAPRPTADGRAIPSSSPGPWSPGGAVAVSVLIEPDHYGGSIAALERVRTAVDVPVLRKDFVLREDQFDVVAADAVLLIVGFVDDIARLVEAARDRGMQPLVEGHTRGELAAVGDAGADLIGVNNRDLAHLWFDLGTVEHVAPAVPDHVTLVAESGVSNPTDVRRLMDAGADAALVGSAIMAGDDVEATTRELVAGTEAAHAAPEPERT